MTSGQSGVTNYTDLTSPPPLPIVEGAELISSSDEDTAARVAAEIAGGKLLHKYLLTNNFPPLQDPEGAMFY